MYCFIDRFEKYLGENYITADIESPLAKVKMDLHDIPFEENSFDVVFCNHVLEHVKDDVRCMQEIRRVLKPNGFALCQSPQRYDLETTYEDSNITDPKEREIHFLQDDHLRIYGRDFGLQLEKSGFTVVPVNMIEKLGFNIHIDIPKIYIKRVCSRPAACLQGTCSLHRLARKF